MTSAATHSTDADARARREARERRWLVAIFALAVVLRLATLGAYPLMDNTEARYAEIARKMLETGNWITPQFHYGVAFWSKPPLAIWLAAASYAAWGVNEFAARFPSLVASLGVVALTFVLGRSRAAPGLPLRAAVVLFTGTLFYVSAGAVMTDAALTFGTTLSMAGFWFAMSRDRPAGWAWRYLFFVGLAIGLLAKGPVAIVLTFLPIGIWTVWKRSIGEAWRRLPWITGSALAAALAVPWYVLAEIRTPGFLRYFLIGEHWDRYTIAGWKGDRFGTAHAWPRGLIWPFAVLATLPWCVVWGVLALRTRREGLFPRPADDGWRAYLWLWLLTSPVFFTPSGNILITYVMPALPAFALLVADAWIAIDHKGGWGPSAKMSGLTIPILVSVAAIAVVPRVAAMHSQRPLVDRYLALRADRDARLLYVTEAPFSAQFYTGGRVLAIRNVAALTPYLDDGRGDFYALTPGQLDARPGLRDRLVDLGTFGNYRLLTSAPPRSAGHAS